MYTLKITYKKVIECPSNNECLKIITKCQYRNGHYHNKRILTYDLSYLK